MITLNQALFAHLQRRDDPKQGLLDAVQAAVQLERATLPPYLYALYSLDQEKNGVIAELIRSVFMEEMLHVALAANLLNALGGDPRIASFDTVPRYPGPLPGGVEDGVVVHLAPFSDSQLDTFLQIEAPDNVLAFRVAGGEVAGEQPRRTIGQFYRGIRDRIGELADGGVNLFTGDPARQLATALEGVVKVSDVASARAAIDTIVEQGEGTEQSPLEAAAATLPAHYYRFAEIKNGKELIRNPDAHPTDPPEAQFIYGGAPIVFDRDGVLPLPTDPKATSFAEGSVERTRIDAFNQTYSAMLVALQAALTGAPATIFGAVRLMRQMSQQAEEMAALGIGPTFEYGAMVGGRFSYTPPA
ncbi:putative protein related to plant photosystem II stability/assembly factor [Luteitalea pratensis]|uniref:Iminophenyl-pyruvate dimer synthase domain-containing protein n=1 Tax=Luteitalea pratensis TaxID=1855912 RepID=A0A143PQY6_LUTPR|nr:ferritin-like protein [Luteitalea pratensis]AMY10841.1 putative protein related to plant photosystem II stability/assembly factor [Luteitalea pratensis]